MLLLPFWEAGLVVQLKLVSNFCHSGPSLLNAGVSGMCLHMQLLCPNLSSSSYYVSFIIAVQFNQTKEDTNFPQCKLCLLIQLWLLKKMIL